MKRKVFLIGNRTENEIQAAMLIAHGYRVEELKTLEGARARLHERVVPDTIVVDVEDHEARVAEFVDYVRVGLGLNTVQIVVAGVHHLDVPSFYEFGVSVALPRPVEAAQVVAAIKSTLG